MRSLAQRVRSAVRVPTGIRKQQFSSLFAGVTSQEFSDKPEFFDNAHKFPVYRRLSPDGKLSGGDLPCSKEELKRMFDIMVQLSAYDSVLYDVQRQGRISFYMQNTGEEAASVGSSAALSREDVCWPQYRELGLFMERGFTLREIVDQCMNTKDEIGKGRQMPVHYCAPELNIQAVTSPLATGIPHAAGAGRAFTLDKADKVAVVYFGDGAASEGDAMVALNFASTLDSQTIFIVRNNGYAISTPVHEQYAGDGIAARGLAFGMHTMRVDGNDIIAVYDATKRAREICVTQSRPVLLELMTYRQGHHSTSDDSSRYRVEGELDTWQTDGIEPISRLRNYLMAEGLVTEEEELVARKQYRKDVLAMIKEIEKKQYAPISDMFNDMYDKLTPELERQKAELFEHLSRHGDKYNMKKYADEPKDQ